jgi:hypothetical protein
MISPVLQAFALFPRCHSSDFDSSFVPFRLLSNAWVVMKKQYEAKKTKTLSKKMHS